MKSEIIASRYAQALLAFAKGIAAEDAVLAEVEWYQKVAAASVSKLLGNPKIPREKKEALMARLFTGDAKKVLFYFVRLLLRKGRISSLNEIFLHYPKQYEQDKGVVKGTLYLSYPIEQGLVESLKSKLELKIKRKISLNVVQDAQILGGFVFSTGTELIDASLKQVLADMGDRLKAAPVL